MNKIGDVKELCRKEFSKLEILDVGNNKIREVPIALVHYLENLNLINLGNNDIDRLPNLFGLHKTLKTIQIDGNPMKSIRRPIIEKGTDSILRFLREKFVEGKDNLVEDWALETEKQSNDYYANDYAYSNQNYGYQQD